MPKMPRFKWVPYLILAASLFSAMFTANLTGAMIKDQARDRFQKQIDETLLLFADRVQLYFATLYNARGLFDVLKTDSVEWDEWTAFVDPETIGLRVPGINAIRFIQRIKRHEKPAFIERMRRGSYGETNGIPEFRIHPESDKEEYYVVQYLEPYESNQAHHGFDVLSEPNREEAFSRARDTGEITATERVILQTDKKSEEPSFLLILPVYRYGASTSTVEERREALLGFVDIACRMKDFIKHTFLKDFLRPDISLEIFDSTELTSDDLLYSSFDFEGLRPQHFGRSGFAAIRTMEIGGQVWALRFQAPSNFRIGAIQKWLPLSVLLAGILFSVLLFLILLFLSTMRLRAEGLAEKMIEDLRSEVQERKKAEEEARRALQIKSEFVSIVSHELRTPLTAIRESLSILEEGAAGTVSEEQRDFLQTASRNVLRLSRLINDILDFQKLEAGRMEFKMVKTDLNLLVLEVRDSFDQVARNKGLTLKAVLEEGLPEIPADKDRIFQVTANLVGNAVKFSHRGAVVLKTEKTSDGVRVSVEDEGIGIRPGDIPKLFQSFSQIDSGEKKNIIGTGLGLVISKRIIEGHRGSIGVRSEYGIGSTFFFTLPQGAQPPAGEGGFHGKR